MEASHAYENNPIALHLRAMNMLYEGLKEKGALVVIPSTAVETMGLGNIAGLSAMANVNPPVDSEKPSCRRRLRVSL